MDHAFGSGGSFTVGIEEELLLVDAGSHALAPVAERVLPGAGLDEAFAAHEAYAAEVELRSPPSRSVEEALAALAGARAAAAGAAAGVDAALLGAGLHPAGAPGDTRLVDQERYRRIAGAMRGLIARTPEAALHVHVGMPDAEAAIRAYNGLRAHLPLLVALSANSAFWFGSDSGLASARWAMVRAYPGRGIPPAFRDFGAYEEAVERSLAAGDLEDYTFLWWDVRPHPRLGTVEVREMDAQAEIGAVAALAALVQGLAAAAAGGGQPPAASDAISWSSFRAARDGLAATIWSEGRLVPLPEAARAAVEVARPHAREAGSDGALAGIERILAEGCGADRQRAAFAAGGMARVLADLVERTAA